MTRLIKKSKKGFTLVELLVVIAILAILASVSVVGYMGFTKKAKQSNAETVMVQVREIIRGELLDGSTVKIADTTTTEAAGDGWTFSLKADSMTVQAEHQDEGFNDSTDTWVASFEDLKDFAGSLTIVKDASNNNDGKALEYKLEEGIVSQWDFSTDVISSR